ncbi:serine/threonine-protein kinase [Nocardioides sp.]|uniref:serine/threonine-protein kinase n=1 Tax=Nocardioides sp. TaxID=35761 RepID=UPI002718C57B|nr:serine/threonine-protein kinase [Nocardioides sp.]MDO9457893.1 serine/threonine-protein kinase [Nocardioides sp.]
MTAPFPSPGDMIGRFRVLAQLGAGGMGVVYDALEVNLDRRVALKVISPMFADDPDFRSRFISEARALASLDSPNVVQVYAHGEEDGYLYIATQLVPDGDLGQTITRWGPAPHGKAAELIEQVASGLADAHAAGLVHRDIKPANVLVRRRGSATVQAYLGDFGIARRVDAEATRVGSAVIGTPSYMAPELHGGATAGVTTDIYSLGCLLWVTLTGQPPYAGATEFEIVGGHVSKPVPQLAGDTPLVDSLNRIIRISMAKEPGHRYRSAVELRDDLREVGRMTGDPAFSTIGTTSLGAPTRAPGSRTPTPTPTPTPGPTPGPPPHRTPTPTPAPTPSGTAGQPYRAPYQPAYQQPAAFTGPTGSTPPRSKRGLWIGLATAAVLLAVSGGVVAAVVAGNDGGGGDNGGNGANGGNGGTGGNSDLTATEQEFVAGDAAAIVDDAEKEMATLNSVRISGTGNSDDGTPGTVDLTITSRGDCAGEIGLEDGRAQLRRVDGRSYVKPDAAFLVASEAGTAEEVQAILSQLGDSWFATPASSDSDDFAELCDIDELLEGDTSQDYTFEKGDVVDLEGASVLAIDQSSADGDLTAYIDVKEPHYLRKLDVPGDEASYSFSRFDEEFTVEAPPADKVIEIPDS